MRITVMRLTVATRLGRSFLGPNVQYGDSIGAHTRTLAVRELKTAVTGEELSKLITNILRDDFDIIMSQIYSITTDNGSNVLAAGKFISRDMFRELESLRGK